MLDTDIFANPPSKYRPIPFWFWNTRLRADDIESQIRDFHAKGLGGFFIHARFGLETEYLSRDWMECVKKAVSVAAELGLEVWLYDENGFPSGIGDLKVSRIREYRSRFVDVTEGDVAAGGRIELDLPVGDVIAARAYRTDEPHADPLDITTIIFESKLIWDAPEGSWHVVVYSECVLEDPNDIVYGVNYLNPEAMRYFFDCTFDPYERAVGEHFGKTIKGIFTDEPTLLPWHHDICWYGRRQHARVVVWDPRIADEVRTSTGLDAPEFLRHLFFDVDESTPDVRRAFWQIVSKLYLRAFFEPYRDWCAQHGLEFTGHCLFEEGLYINTDFQANLPAALATMDIPGCDHLGKVAEHPYGGSANLPQQLTNVQGPKLVASVAHSIGSEAVLSETYGCAGWDLSIEKMKWIADWQYSLGISMLCPHALFASIEGFRKTDAPPSHNHLPSWKHYKAFSDYIGRISYIVRQGRHVAKIALLYPLSEFQGLHRVGESDEKDRALSDSFDLCAAILPRLHFDYDIITESALAQAGIDDGRLLVGDESFELIIAPKSALRCGLAETVQCFVDSGGRWVDPPAVAGAIDREWFSAALDSSIRAAISPDVTISSPAGVRLADVRYLHRQIDNTHVYFVANTSDKPCETRVSFEGQGAVELWDPETGCVRDPAAVEMRAETVEVRHDFAAFGSMVVVVDRSKEASCRPLDKPRRTELLLLPDEWRFETRGPNALVISELAMSLKVTGDGVAYTYASFFNCEYVPDSLLLMLDDIEYRSSLMGRMRLSVSVNGRVWDRPVFGRYLDRGFRTLDISDAVVSGRNELSITVSHSPWSGPPQVITAPIALLGDFACDPSVKTLLPPAKAAFSGSWTEFGYPFYSGSAVYSLGFRVPRGAADGRLILSVESVADAASISVNGKTAAVRVWRPWEADITELVTDGRNTLDIEVTNSLANFVEQRPVPSGLLGRARLFVEK